MWPQEFHFFIMFEYFCLASKVKTEIIEAKHQTCYQILGLELPKFKEYFIKFIFKDLLTSSIIFKGRVCYIFLSLFCMSKREDLWNKEKCFLFHFESSFHFWDNKILNFQIFKCHNIIKCLSMKHETHFIE